MIDTTVFRQELERRKGRQAQLQHDLQSAEARLKDAVKEKACCEEAQTIVQVVAQKTQEELEYHIGELVTLAMAAIFDDPYELKLEFVQRRGRTEADIWFVRDGKKVHPLTASGGGAVDVAAFALRIALWGLAQPKSRPVLVLDEPLRFLSRGYLPKASAMVKEISNRLGIQIIMVTHIDDLTQCSDRVFEVANKNGVSEVH